MRHLGDFRPTEWETFLGRRGGTYVDDLVTCTKDRANRPICRRTVEAAPAARARGAIAALQRAADKLLNLIPAYQMAEVTLVGGEKLYASFERDPIQKRSGYDGLLGPSAHGWINGAFILATALSEVPADVVLATFAPTEAVFARLAVPLAAYFNGVADNIDSLIEAYKRAPRALPQIAPETIRVVEEVVTRRRVRVRGAGAIIAAGAVGLGSVAALGVAKGAGAAKAAAAAGLLGTLGASRRVPTLEQRLRGMSDNDLIVTSRRLESAPNSGSKAALIAVRREKARRLSRVLAPSRPRTLGAPRRVRQKQDERWGATLPAPTPEQRLRSMSDGDLIVTSQRLATATDAGSKTALIAMRREMARRKLRVPW